MSTYSGKIRCKKFVSYIRYGKFSTSRNIWRLSPYRYSTFNRAYFVSMAAADAGITEEQMSAALRAYQTQFDQLLLNGHSIEMQGLGNFRLSCSVKSVPDVEDYDMETLFQRLRVVLRPDNELRNEIKSIQHIVDAPISAKSGDGAYVLNYQLPFTKTDSNPKLRIMPAPSDRQGISVNYMTDLFFVVSDSEYGDVKLEATVEGTGLRFADADSGFSISFDVSQDGTYLQADEFVLGTGYTIKMFGGK